MGGHLERDVLSSRLRYVHTEHKTNARVFPPDVGLALPQLDVGVPELQDPSTVDSVRRDKYVSKTDNGNVYLKKKWRLSGNMFNDSEMHVLKCSHCFHVVLWLQGDLQDFGAVDDLLIAGGRNGLTGDAVDLVKGVGLEDALICCTNEDLQTKWLLASVAM